MWTAVLVFIFLIGSTPVIFERIYNGIFPHVSAAQPVEEIKINLDADISDQDKIEINEILEKWQPNIITGYAFYPRNLNGTNLKDVPIALQNSAEDTFLTFKLIHPNNFSTVLMPNQETVDIHNQDKIYVAGCNVSGKIITHDLIIIKPESVLLYHSDLEFNSCKHFQ